MSKVYIKQGFAYTKKNGKEAPVSAIEVPTDKDCCYLDCCCNAIRMTDRVTGRRMVLALENGAFVPYAEEDFVCNNGVAQ